MDLESLKRHLVLTSAAEVDGICAPLKRIDISYFSFVRSFKDGTHIRLSNNADWTAHYYARSFYNVVLHQVPDKDCNILWSSIDKYPLFSDASEYFDVDNGTVIVIKYDDVVERYFFGATRGNHHVNHIYLFRTELLYKFILYFKEQAKSLIEKSERSKIIVPKKIIDEDVEFYSSEVIKGFLDEIKIKNVTLNIHGRDFSISKKEAQILSLSKLGYSTKEISKESGIAIKTVDSYRSELKNKLNLNSTRDLISKVPSQSLLDYRLYT